MNPERDADSVEKAWRLAESVRVGFLTLHEGGGMSARPMYALIPDDREAIWFITYRQSPKIAEAEQHSDALLSFSTGEKGEHLVMMGTLTVVDDRDKLKSLWTEGAEKYFAKGADDPAAILLKFDPSRAEYWARAGGNPISFAIEYAKAKLTGDTSKLTEHAKVTL